MRLRVEPNLLGSVLVELRKTYPRVMGLISRERGVYFSMRDELSGNGDQEVRLLIQIELIL